MPEGSLAPRFKLSRFIILFLLFSPSLNFGSEKTNVPVLAPEKQSVKVAFTSLSGNMTPLWIAIDKGFFNEQGLKADGIYTRTVTGIQAMLAGDVHFINAGCTEMMKARKAGADIVLVAMINRYNRYVIAARSEITHANQLAGKKMAVNLLNDVSHIWASFALKDAGIDPKSISFVPIGSTPERFRALRLGAVDAIVYGGPLDELRDLKLNIVLNLFERKIPSCGSGIGVSEAFMKIHPLTVEAFMRGFVKGNAFFKVGRPAEGQTILARYIKSNPKDKRTEQLYGHYREGAAEYPEVTREGIESLLGVLAQQDKSWLGWNPKHFYETSVTDKLRAFYDSAYRELKKQN